MNRHRKYRESRAQSSKEAARAEPNLFELCRVAPEFEELNLFELPRRIRYSPCVIEQSEKRVIVQSRQRCFASQTHGKVMKKPSHLQAKIELFFFNFQYSARRRQETLA